MSLHLITTDQQPTMSSREIAELTGKRHDNVMAVCRSLRAAAVCPEIQETPYTNEQNGQTYLECRLTKRDSLVLIARLSPEFTARVVDRWQELEAGAVPAHQIPQTYAQALMLAAKQAEQIEHQQAQLEAARPAVEFVGRYVEAEGLKGFREVCKLLKANEARFRDFLFARKVMYRLGGQLTAYQDHIDAGRFVCLTNVARHNNHEYQDCKFTPKGTEWIAGEWAKHCLRAHSLVEA